MGVGIYVNLRIVVYAATVTSQTVSHVPINSCLQNAASAFERRRRWRHSSDIVEECLKLFTRHRTNFLELSYVGAATIQVFRRTSVSMEIVPDRQLQVRVQATGFHVLDTTDDADS